MPMKGASAILNVRACAISKISPDEGLKQIWGYVAALFFGLAIVAAVPWLSTGFLKF